MIRIQGFTSKPITIFVATLLLGSCTTTNLDISNSNLVNSIAYTSALTILQRQNIKSGQYTSSCKTGTRKKILNYPNYEGLPVEECVYENNKLIAYVVNLNPKPKQIATWVANACLSLKNANQRKCAKTLLTSMKKSNGYQFNIAGTVVESGKASGCPHGKHYYIQFRDGVTVRLEDEDRLCLFEERSIEQQKADSRSTNLRAYFYSRMSTLQLHQYEKITNTQLPKTTIRHIRRQQYHATLEWLAKSRESYITAWKTGNYSFLNYKAKSLVGEF